MLILIETWCLGGASSLPSPYLYAPQRRIFRFIGRFFLAFEPRARVAGPAGDKQPAILRKIRDTLEPYNLLLQQYSRAERSFYVARESPQNRFAMLTHFRQKWSRTTLIPGVSNNADLCIIQYRAKLIR